MIANLVMVIIGVIMLGIGIFFAVGKLENLFEKIRKSKYEVKQKKKVKEMCLKMGELDMLIGIVLLLNGLVENFNKHLFGVIVFAWIIVACFDILFVYVTRKK